MLIPLETYAGEKGFYKIVAKNRQKKKYLLEVYQKQMLICMLR